MVGNKRVRQLIDARTRSVSWLATKTFAWLPATHPWLSKFCSDEIPPFVKRSFIVKV